MPAKRTTPLWAENRDNAQRTGRKAVEVEVQVGSWEYGIELGRAGGGAPLDIGKSQLRPSQ
jgi:hypothetical protein